MTEASLPKTCTAFAGMHRIASGSLREVARQTKEVIDRGSQAPILLFDDETSETIEVDFRGTAADVLEKLGKMAGDSTSEITAPAEPTAPRRPGRPKLGVVAHEVTLLPRHWDWLNSQPGGASVTLRKLVEQSRRSGENKDKVRRSQDAAYRFMLAMAGDLPGYEEATRALFAGNQEHFDALVEPWPTDVRNHARKLAAVAVGGQPALDNR